MNWKIKGVASAFAVAGIFVATSAKGVDTVAIDELTLVNEAAYAAELAECPDGAATVEECPVCQEAAQDGEEVASADSHSHGGHSHGGHSHGGHSHSHSHGHQHHHHHHPGAAAATSDYPTPDVAVR